MAEQPRLRVLCPSLYEILEGAAEHLDDPAVVEAAGKIKGLDQNGLTAIALCPVCVCLHAVFVASLILAVLGW